MDTAEWFDLWRHEEDSPFRLLEFIQQEDAVFIGFNSNSFDNLIVSAWCRGLTELEIKRIGDDIIINRLNQWVAYQKYSLRNRFKDCIDLIEVSPSFVGLKAYGARMHMPVLQDMPISHDTYITKDQEPVILEYCHNDVDTTEELTRRLEGQIMLRIDMSRKYGVDMRSKSDSQMAEQAYITSMGLRRKDNKIPETIRYVAPAYLKFRDANLQNLLDRVKAHVFDMNQKTGHVILPDFLGNEIVNFNSGSYQLGVGGIHSTHDKKVCHVAGDDVITDIDGASFYPTIIIESGLIPSGLGKRFMDEYRVIYERRLAAKAAKDKVTDATLKISLNGTFGKLASKYSVLYAPDLMLAVTLTGQFMLLMLIERLEEVGALTLSANTDGIAIRHSKGISDLVEKTVEEFGKEVGMVFEFTPYRALAMKDVNNYIAVKPDRELKVKGIYSPLSLSKNPTAQVSADAVGQWLARGTPFLDTIRAAPFKDFISARNVTGGGVQGDEFLGKVVRWYQSTDKDMPPLTYAKNGNKVPKTDGARACMVVLDFEKHPADLDITWYYKEAIKIAVSLGCERYLQPDELTLTAPPPKKVRKSKNV
jgi:DNA polymerase elongation subunit (family B)